MSCTRLTFNTSILVVVFMKGKLVFLFLTMVVIMSMLSGCSSNTTGTANTTTIIGGLRRLRCGISYGELYIDLDNRVLVGQPYIDAYELQEQQQWSGGALTTAMVNRLPDIAKSGVFWPDWPIIPYHIPTKNKNILNGFAIDWTFGVHQHPWELWWSSESKDPNPLDWKKTYDICEKFMNTRLFHDKNCRLCNIKA
jgi:hypothetical protein